MFFVNCYSEIPRVKNEKLWFRNHLHWSRCSDSRLGQVILHNLQRLIFFKNTNHTDYDDNFWRKYGSQCFHFSRMSMLPHCFHFLHFQQNICWFEINCREECWWGELRWKCKTQRKIQTKAFLLEVLLFSQGISKMKNNDEYKFRAALILKRHLVRLRACFYDSV